MLKALICLLAAVATCSALVISNGKTVMKVDKRTLRGDQATDAQLKNIRHLLEVLKSDETSFSENTSNNAVEDWKVEAHRQGKHDLFSESTFTSDTSYHLHDRGMYLNLDAHAPDELRSIGSSHIEHCSDHASTAEVGHFVLGSERNSKLNEVVMRKVIGKSIANGCTILHTEDVHPLEMFSRVTGNVVVESPFQRTYSHSQASPIHEESSKFVSIDSPLVKCTDPAYAKVAHTFGGTDDLFQKGVSGFKTPNDDFEIAWCITCVSFFL